MTPRVPSGIPGLDHLVGGGFPARRSVLVCGGAGTGKTVLALQFLTTGLEAGEGGLFVSVDQKPRHVIEDGDGFGWKIGQAVADKRLAVLDPAPWFTAAREPGQRQGVRQLVAELARRTSETKARRLVIDSLTSLVPGRATDDEGRDFLRELIFSLEDNLECTCLFTTGEDRASGTARLVAQLCSGLIALDVVPGTDGRLERRLALLKLRGTAVEPWQRRFEIASGVGLVLRPESR